MPTASPWSTPVPTSRRDGPAVVVATGTSTEVGRIAELTEGAEEPATPLERRLAQLGRHLAIAAVGIFLLILAVATWHGLAFSEVLMVALSQLVSTVPEGLPVATTVALAVGMQRMARRGAIVRRLAAVESLGCTTVICTDKTGTLTRNEMTVVALWLPDGRTLSPTPPASRPRPSSVTAMRWSPPGATPPSRPSSRRRPSATTPASFRRTKRSRAGAPSAIPPRPLCSRWRSRAESTRPRPRSAPRGRASPLRRRRQDDGDRAPRAGRPGGDGEGRARGRAPALRGGARGGPCTRSRTRSGRTPPGPRMRSPGRRCVCSPSRGRRAPSRRARIPWGPLRGRLQLLGMAGELDPPRPDAVQSVSRLPRGGHPPGDGHRGPPPDRRGHRQEPRHLPRRRPDPRRPRAGAPLRGGSPEGRRPRGAVFARVHRSRSSASWRRSRPAGRSWR